MEFEYETTTKRCGCVEHYTYSEYRGMGPIQGSEKRWTELCCSHRTSCGGYTDKIHKLKASLENKNKRLEEENRMLKIKLRAAEELIEMITSNRD